MSWKVSFKRSKNISGNIGTALSSVARSLPLDGHNVYTGNGGDRGSTVVKVAGSIPAGVSGFFIDIKSFRSHYGPGVDSASNRNEYQ